MERSDPLGVLETTRFVLQEAQFVHLSPDGLDRVAEALLDLAGRQPELGSSPPLARRPRADGQLRSRARRPELLLLARAALARRLPGPGVRWLLGAGCGAPPRYRAG
jgi:hypothetical protein